MMVSKPKLDVLQSTRSPIKEESNSRLPLYNWLAPQVGEKVRMPSGEIVTVPELDADGDPIEPASTGRLVSHNEFVPSYSPNPKPEKKEKKVRNAIK